MQFLLVLQHILDHHFVAFEDLELAVQRFEVLEFLGDAHILYFLCCFLDVLLKILPGLLLYHNFINFSM